MKRREDRGVRHWRFVRSSARHYHVLGADVIRTLLSKPSAVYGCMCPATKEAKVQKLALVLVLVLVACGAPQSAEPEELVAIESASLDPVVEPPALYTELEPGEWVGTLPFGAPLNDTGHRERAYRLWAIPDRMIRLTLSSGEMDVLLRVVLPDGTELTNDDYSGTNSRLQFAVPGGGEVRVTATTFAPGLYGKFELRLDVLDPASGLRFDADGQVAGQLTWGTRMPGIGAEPDESVWFEAERGERISVRVTSPHFDTLATVYSPDGITWDNDDANDTGPDATESIYDSTVEMIAPVAGLYQLVVSAYGEIGEGQFLVRSTRIPAPLLGDDGSPPSGGYTGVDGTGRLYAVLVGVTTYYDAPLYGCADDATYLGEALASRGLADDTTMIVLTDKDATREAVRVAIAEIAAQAQPEDAVLVFFSGHGGVQDANEDDTLELDGLDETLVFADQAVTDNEFVGWLDAIGSDLLVLAIDACQSGGFARDFMTRPGRLGLFSSDEDVLSSTAEAVGAGGFLSYYLRQAVAGFYDARPADGALMAGELTDAIQQGFIDQHRAMNADGSFEPLQRLVVERGSFGWSDVLWYYPRSADGAEVPLPSTCWQSGQGEAVVSDEGGSCR